MTTIAFLGLGALAALILSVVEQNRLAADRARAEVAAKTHLSAIGERVERALSATYALAALVRQGKGQVQNFDAIAGEMVRVYPGVGSLQLAPDGVIRQLVPRAGNEKAIGHDLLKDPARTKEAFLARDTGKLTLAGPFNLVQGGKGAVGRLPVFLPDTSGEERFWGFTCVLIRFPDILPAEHFAQLKESGYDFILWRIHPDTGKQDVITASADHLLQDPVEARLSIPNGEWMLAVAPIRGWRTFNSLLGGIGLAVLFSTMGAALVNIVLRQPIALRRQVEERTRELQESRAVLQESEERWQYALEGAGDGVWDWDVRTNAVFFSPRWKGMLGFEDHEIGNDFAEWDMRLHPDDREYAHAEIQNYLSGRTSVYHIEHRLLCKDGSWKWILARGKIVARDAQGKPLRLIGTHTDITVRKEMEMALQLEKNFINAIMDSIPGMLFVYDDQGRLVRWNKKHEEMTGYSADELFGMHLLEWYKGDEETTAFIAERVQKAQIEGFADAEANLRIKDGSRIPMYFTAVPVTIAGKSYFTGIGIDISERRKVEEEKEKLTEQLLQAQKMESVGRLAGGVAHDFNNMLAVIFISLELIKMELNHDVPMLAHLEQIERAASRARDITRQLLAFSRKQIIVPKVVSLNEVIAETEKAIIRLIGEDIEVCFFAGQGLAHVMIDPVQVDQVLINLALNARDAMPDGGKLTIETANVEFDEAYCREHDDVRPGHYVQVSVSDEGCGMEREALKNIFEPFFTTKEVGKGTGLGLAMVYGVMKQNNGFVTVYSEVGQGTTFKLYFRRAEDSEAVAESPEPAEAIKGSGDILLVEDDDMLRRITGTTLEELGYAVTAAANPDEAIAIAANSPAPYSLLLTDVVMPGMNGKQLSDRLLEMQPSIKVLYMSGYTENAIVHRGVLDEGLHFIQKPFRVKELSWKIYHILNP